MPRSSRSSKSRKHSSKVSGSDDDLKLKEKDIVSVRVSGSSEKRKHSKDLNGDVCDEFTNTNNSSKRRDEKCEKSDRWNGWSSDEKGVVVNVENKEVLKLKDFSKVVGESKSKSSRSVIVLEKRKSEKESARKESSQYKENKEFKEKEKDRGRKGHSDNVDKVEGESSLKQVENQSSKRGKEITAEEAQVLLRSHLCNPNFIFSVFSDSPDSNYSKLKFIVSSSVTEACNNSILLLGPRGCGKIAVLDLVLEDLLKEYPEMISVIKLNGLLHCDDNCAIKEIARQLCIEHELMFSKMASFDDNSQFMIAMLRECGLAHKTVVFVLDEFDLFAQGKQRLLYSLLDAMQSVSSQAVVIGVSCRLDADQLLEKRVRSRFSHRKLLFLPPQKDDLQRLLKHILLLPTDSTLPNDYVTAFNSRISTILIDKRFVEVTDKLLDSDSTISNFLRFLFSAVSYIDLKSGFMTLENFKSALSTIQRQPKQDCLKDCSILELYIMVCMKRLEVKEQESYNFNSVMKEYKTIHDSFQTSDNYSRSVCLRAFEHLLERQLIEFADRGHNQSIEFRSVKLLISPSELHQWLKSDRTCPAILQKLMES